MCEKNCYGTGSDGCNSQGFKLLERAPGVSVEEIRSKTAGKLIVEGEIPEWFFNKLASINKYIKKQPLGLLF
jgi:hypothetical protein